MSAAGRVQRAAGGRAGGPAPAGTDAHRVHPEPEGCAHGEGKEAGGECLLPALAKQLARQMLTRGFPGPLLSLRVPVLSLHDSHCYRYVIPGLAFTFNSRCYLLVLGYQSSSCLYTWSKTG